MRPACSGWPPDQTGWKLTDLEQPHRGDPDIVEEMRYKRILSAVAKGRNG